MRRGKATEPESTSQKCELSCCLAIDQQSRHHRVSDRPISTLLYARVGCRIERVLVDIFGNIKLGAVWMTRRCPTETIQVETAHAKREAASSRQTAGGHAEQIPAFAARSYG